MKEFKPESFGPTCAELLCGNRLCDLGPGEPTREWKEKLNALSVDSVLNGITVADRNMAQCCISGLWLLHNFLDESHEISQTIHSPTGSYWHAIMHRREPDFSNSKYWFRQVGHHEIFPQLCESSRELASQHDRDQHAEFLVTQSDWEPFQFVDFCEAAIGGRSESVELAQQIARLEWELLFDYCYQHAIMLRCNAASNVDLVSKSCRFLSRNISVIHISSNRVRVERDDL